MKASDISEEEEINQFSEIKILIEVNNRFLEAENDRLRKKERSE
jgi:hypothetical protein